MPAPPFPTDEQVAVGKTPYVRFDRNDSSVPHTQVRRTLTVVASLEQVRVVDGATVLATHARSFDAGVQVEDPAHIAELVARKHAARQHRGQDRLIQAVPIAQTLLTKAAERGEPLGSLTAALLRLLEAHGATELTAGIEEALARGVAQTNAVRQALERRREARGQPPPIPVTLPADARVREVVVRTAALGDYDQLHDAPSQEA
ncbi:Mu transposase domain-containing protein [Lamprobacter sp.]|uniref:Mu transposase domain-containing protein n=1 Tax=Lamprobacter sp. TaxID=3100796 RepID=UPI003A4D2EA4